MSAIGSYQVIVRKEFPGCLALARKVHPETSGKWIFKQTQLVGREAFEKAWRAALVRVVDFDYSGYVIGNYLDAQELINGLKVMAEQSEAGESLSKVFTAAFPFEEQIQLPGLPQDKLLAFCREEYGDDAAVMVEAINAAHSFYHRGLDEITAENLVVFVIN